jgi:hypothetical protein
MLTAIAMVLVGLLLGVLIGWLWHGLVSHNAATVFASDALPFGHRHEGPEACEVCHDLLPRTALRTHDGHWRCAAHKGV